MAEVETRAERHTGAAGEAAERHPYEVSYLREDGNDVVEVIWATNHGEAVKEAEKHGLDILYRVKRETEEEYQRAHGGSRHSVVLPIVVAVLFAAAIVGLVLWRRGLL